MDHSVMLDFHEPQSREPIAGPFYNHVYGGVARDIFVTKEQFARFFDVVIEEIDWVMPRCKVFNQFFDNGEVYGYVDDPEGMYRITIINRTHGALMDHAVRTTVSNSQN